MRDTTLGVDLSESTAQLTVVDGEGTVLSRAEAPADATTSVIRDAARRAIAGAGGSVSGIGVAMLHAGEEVPTDMMLALREASSAQTDIVAVAAGTAAAIAEQWCGAARGLKQVVTFAIAEHATAGVILNGEPWRGAHGLASSVGWLALNPVEREDYRRFGGLEAEVGSAGIVRRFVWRIKSGDTSAVVDQVDGDFAKITADDIFQGSRSGDGVSISVVRDTAKYVGMAVANLVSLFDPEVVVLGGVISQTGDIMLEAIKSECARRLQPQQADVARLVLSTLGREAAAVGAARAVSRGGA